MNFCRMDGNCAVYDSPSDLPGLAHQNPLCYSCRDAAATTIRALRYDYVDLTQQLMPGDARNQVGKIFRPKPESQAPLNERALFVRDDIVLFAGAVTQALRRALGLSLYRRMPTREGFQLDADVKFLAERVSELAELEPTTSYYTDSPEPQTLDGVAMLELAGALHRKARRLCGLEPQLMQVPGYCPQCNAASLRRHDDNDEKVWCAACGYRVTLAGIVQLARLNLHPHA